MVLEQKANHLFNELLRDIPLDLREEVRNKAIKEAEKISLLKESTIIEEESIVAGLILSLPIHLRANFRSVLDYHQIDPIVYEKYLTS